MINPDEFDELVKLICPHCRRGVPSQFHPIQNEVGHNWVHPTQPRPDDADMLGYAACWASGLRLSRFNPTDKKADVELVR